ncbi:MAG: hypothetical protein M1482_05605 [Chloroflexi bacterium]|nr:hypothetical protein [Chloroflexota bacterium]
MIHSFVSPSKKGVLLRRTANYSAGSRGTTVMPIRFAARPYWFRLFSHLGVRELVGCAFKIGLAARAAQIVRDAAEIYRDVGPLAFDTFAAHGIGQHFGLPPQESLERSRCPNMRRVPSEMLLPLRQDRLAIQKMAT